MKAIFKRHDHKHAPAMVHCRGATQAFPERFERPARLIEGLSRHGIEIVAPRDFGVGPILAVHDPDYVEFLRNAYSDWQMMREGGVGAGEIVEASGFSLRHRYKRVPAQVSVRADYYLSGGWAPIDEGTFEAAVASAHSALEAASIVADGESAAYALCRPPGHHAYADLAGGYCYINNAAVAAQLLTERQLRVSILDIDAHHGNGTQGIFYNRGDVQFLSIHADPAQIFPFYCGYADERGEGAGQGANLNLPLALGTGDEGFRQALGVALSSVDNFGPDVLVVSLGLDISAADATRLLSVSPEGFTRIGAEIAGRRLPTVLVQEGGYGLDHLAGDLAAFLEGFLDAR